MKKIISLILSTAMLISCCNSTVFATENLSTKPSKDAAYAYNYLETKFLSNLGLKEISEYLDNFYKSLENCSIVKKSIILSAAASVPLFTTDFGKLMRNFYLFKILSENFYDYVKSKFTSDTNNILTPEKALHILKNELTFLKGQENAKEKINDVVAGIIYDKEMAKLKNKKYNHGDIIYIPGPSGSGKSFVATKISHALSTSEPFIISASEVDLQDKKSVVKQLFKFNNYYYDDNKDDSASSHNLVQYISKNKNGVIIINEYDKMWDKSLDEVLRTIVDQGTISINGNILDCSGTTFIITSNESSYSINGGNQDIIEKIDDGTGTRTNISHDKSFMNRVKLIEFEKLKEKDYEEIINAEYNYEFLEYWEKLLNIKINLGDTVNHIAKKVIQENKGTRSIKNIFDKLIHKLIILKFKTNAEDKNNEIKNYLLSYNENTNEFTFDLKSSQN